MRATRKTNALVWAFVAKAADEESSIRDERSDEEARIHKKE